MATPINYIDPDGRFASAAYQTVSPVVIGALTNPRVHGCLRAAAGFGEATIGATFTLATNGAGAVLGGVVLAHGLDNFQAGLSQAFSGQIKDPATVQMLQMAGMSHNQAHFTNDFGMLLATGGLEGALYLGTRAAPSFFNSRYSTFVENVNIQFGQISVKYSFTHGPHAGRSIGEVARNLRLGKVSPNTLPIEFVYKNGQAVTLNNRSLLALKRAKLEPTIIHNLTGNQAAEALLNSHLRGSLPSYTIRVRGGLPGTSLIE
jgi:hypothetical protein